MTGIPLSKDDLRLVADALTNLHWKMEKEGNKGPAWMKARQLEDRIGSLQGESFTLSATE
jgi:hypothetical protein